jgi:hypothetical protein
MEDEKTHDGRLQGSSTLSMAQLYVEEAADKRK